MLATINVLSYARCGRCCLKRRLNFFFFFLTKEMTHFSSCPKKLILVLFTVGHSSGLYCVFDLADFYVCWMPFLTQPQSDFSPPESSHSYFLIYSRATGLKQRGPLFVLYEYMFILCLFAYLCAYFMCFFKQQKKKNRKNAHHTQKVVNIKRGIKIMLSEICYKM